MSDESFEPESSSVTVTPCTRQNCSPENEGNAFSTSRGLSYLQEDQVSNDMDKWMYDVDVRKCCIIIGVCTLHVHRIRFKRDRKPIWDDADDDLVVVRNHSNSSPPNFYYWR